MLFYADGLWNTYQVKLAVAFLALIVLFTFILEFISIKPSEADYFRVMSFREWKTGREIRQELQKHKGGWMLGVKVYHDLSELRKKGLVEQNIEEKIVDGSTIKVYSFRKKFCSVST